jgi:hypothetical protein
MNRCIYCLRDATQTTFYGKEHIVPSLLGSFTPLNPTFLARDEMVCGPCNSVVFSALETIFAEDTLEGVYAQRLCLSARKSVILRGQRYNIARIQGFGDTFFDRMFLFLKHTEDGVRVVLRDQIKVRRSEDGSRVFLPEALAGLTPGSRDFERIARALQQVKPADICVFAESTEAHTRIVDLLRAFGVNYPHKEPRWHPITPGKPDLIEERHEGEIDKDIGRVIAKIAFNYFSYCALQSGERALLLSPSFESVRAFVHHGHGELRDIVPSFNEPPILQDERNQDERVVAHLVTFQPEGSKIVARLTFFGFHVYKVVLGDLPATCARNDFGCGHLFDPFKGAIHSLVQRPPPNADEDSIRATFGLFKRF